MPKRVTIRDVATEAGVSIGTASKALNGQGKLRSETRERVTEVAQRLGFAPPAKQRHRPPRAAAPRGGRR